MSGEIKDSGLIDYPFPLRPDVTAHLVLPNDLSERDAERLLNFIETLVLEGHEHE